MSSGSLTPEEYQALLNGPALAPPPGVVPNLSGATPAYTGIITEFVISEVIFLGALAARLLANCFVAHRFGAEDYVICVASVIHLGIDILGFFVVQHGDGKHMWNMTLGEFIDLNELIYYWGWLYIATVTLIKTAILLQFIRVLAPRKANRTAWLVCWINIIINVLFYSSDVLLQIFRCRPIDAAWNVLKPGQCMSLKDIYYSNAIFGIVSDIAILVIPIPIIFKLNMSLKRKLSIATVFATGILACIGSSVRFYYTYKVFAEPDLTYYILILGYWGLIEMATGMVVFCLPIFPQFHFLVKKTFRGYLTLTSGSSVPEASMENVEVQPPKVARTQYEMPSLASFEQRTVSQQRITQTTEFRISSETGNSMEEVRNHTLERGW